MTLALKRRTTVTGPTLGAGYAMGLLNFAVAKGANREKLLELSQISAGDLEDLDNRIPLARYVALFKAGIECTGEPALALQFGAAVRMQEVSIVGLICEACETTLDAGVQMNRYARLVFDAGGSEAAGMIQLVRNETGLWMEIRSDSFIGNPFAAESEFARLVWNARAMFGSNPYFQSIPFPLAIHFTHEEPSYRAEYDRIFQAPAVFGSKWNAMQIDEGFLALRQPPVNRYVFGLLSSRAETLLKELEASKTTRGRVESLLMPILHTGEAHMHMIADKMGLSHQSLYRSLKAEGATFEKVLDELRHKMALHYLGGKKVSVNETAYLVGFSDSTAFSRAFKRWTGTSPRALLASKTENRRSGDS